MAGTRVKRRRPLLLLAALALAGIAMVPAPSWSQLQAPGVAARVNGQPIMAERLERGFEEYLREKRINIGALRSPQRAKTLKREVLDLLIEQELLWQEAQRQRLVAGDDEAARALAELRSRYSDGTSFAARLSTEGYTEAGYTEHLRRLLSARKLLDRLEAAVVVDDAQVAAFYRRHAERFVQPEQRRLSHIALRLEGEAQRPQARARLQALIEALRGGADFAALARQHSDAPQAAQGGDLGFVQRSDLAEPLAAAAFALLPGELSAVVDTVDGVHLLRLESLRQAQQLPESALRERIAAFLRSEQAEQARGALVRRLLASARIEVLVPLPAQAGSDEAFGPAQRARALQP